MDASSDPRAGEWTDVARDCLVRAIRKPLSVLDLPPREVELTVRLMRRARLLGRLAAAIDEAGRMDALPAVVADQLASALVATEAHQRAALWELDRIGWALQELTEVPLIALKGSAYALAGLPNAHGRSFADVDVMVPQRVLPLVEATMKARGWQVAELTAYDDRHYRRRSHELPPLSHAERDVEVDLHHAIVMPTARLKPPPALLFEAARPVAGSRFKVLAPADMVLHAMAHLFYGGDFADALRELVDIVDLLEHFGDREPDFWDGFWPRARQLDLERPAYYGLWFGRELLGLAVPDSAWAAAGSGQPPWLAARLMAMAVPGALVPCHPDGRVGPWTRAGRFALYVRSHWIKMPWPMLARHLAVKAYRRTLQA